MRNIKSEEIKDFIKLIKKSDIASIIPNKGYLFFPIEEAEIEVETEYNIILLEEPVAKTGRNLLLKSGILIKSFEDISIAYVTMDYPYEFSVAKFFNMLPNPVTKSESIKFLSELNAKLIREEYVLTEFAI